jgi:hypothetical protein
MKMQMIDDLSAFYTTICEQAVSTIGQLELFGDDLDRFDHMGNEGEMFGLYDLEGGDVFFGDDQDVNGGDGVNVVKCQYMFIFPYTCTGDRSINDLTKQTGHDAASSYAWVNRLYAHFSPYCIRYILACPKRRRVVEKKTVNHNGMYDEKA